MLSDYVESYYLPNVFDEWLQHKTTPEVTSELVESDFLKTDVRKIIDMEDGFNTTMNMVDVINLICRFTWKDMET